MHNTYMCIYIYIYREREMYAHIHIYTHTYIYIYIYIVVVFEPEGLPYKFLFFCSGGGQVILQRL